MFDKLFKITRPKQPRGKIGNSLLHWKILADEHLKVSEIIYRQILDDYKLLKVKNTLGYYPTNERQYFLSIGLSLENILKGIIIYHNPVFVTTKISSEVKNHNLKQISGLVPIAFTDNQIDIFEFLGFYISWMGKYPIPTSPNQEFITLSYKIGFIRKEFIHLHQDLTEYMITICGLEQKYKKLPFT